MLAADVEIVDIDGRHWANWYDLLLPPALSPHAATPPRWAAVFIEAGQVVHAVVSGHGALVPDLVPFAGTSREALADLREALDVGAVVVLSTDALPEVMAEIEGSLRLGDDIVAQGLTMLRALKRLHGAGVWTEPHLLDLLPTPPYEALQKTFDLLIPNNTSLTAYVFEDDGSDVHASIIALKVAGHIDLVTTHQALEDSLSGPALARQWKAQRKRLLRLINDRVGKPSVGVFMDKAAYRRILTGPTDQLSRELNNRNVVIDPAPAWLLGLLGGATAMAIAGRSAKAFAKMLPPSARKLASDLATSAQDVMRSSNASPFALLGFDPIELWFRVRHFYGAPSEGKMPQ